MIILIGAAIAFMLIGFFGYNPLRKKFAGVIGVGGSYIILLGIMLLCAAIGQIIRTAGGDHSVSTLEIMGTGVIALLCLGYMVFVMIGRCETTAQRVALPFVACLIGFGFIWRLLAAIVLHMPMESGKQEEKSVFPPRIYDPQGVLFDLVYAGTDSAQYECAKYGTKVRFYDTDFRDGGTPTGWTRG